MRMHKTSVDPKEHDTKIAAKYHELDKARQQVAYAEDTLRRLAGQEHHYFSNRASSQAWATFSWEQTPAGRDYKHFEHATLEQAMKVLGDLGNDHRNISKSSKTVGEALASYVDRVEVVQDIREEIDTLEMAYTGWSRFFLVTSSQGHIHSSMRCHTCRPTTTFGWLPELSGLTEDAAVEAHGPALCTECFKSAPVEWTGQKITKAAANKAAA